jgi:hypothetical protein
VITLTREEAQQVLDALLAWEEESSGYGWSENDEECVALLRARLAQPEPEPVAWMMLENKLVPIHTAPPQREWQGLTDEEIRNEANHHVFDESFFNGAVWARGKIKEKNNG